MTAVIHCPPYADIMYACVLLGHSSLGATQVLQSMGWRSVVNKGCVCVTFGGKHNEHLITLPLLKVATHSLLNHSNILLP